MNRIKEIINKWGPYSLFPYAPKMEETFDVEDLEQAKFCPDCYENKR